MHARKLGVLTLAACLLLPHTLGCLFPTPAPTRTTNQGGGNLLTATGKVVGGQMTTLTADEIQIAADTINDLNPELDLTLDDEQAQVVVDFLTANDINTFDDFQNLDLNDVQIPPNAAVLLQNLSLLGAGAG